MCILRWCETHFLWKHLLNKEHAVSVSFTILVQLKHIPLFSMLDLHAVSSFGCFFSLSFFLSSLASSFFLFSFSWNQAFHVLHVIINGLFSVFLLHFLSDVHGHCKTSWMGEMYSLLSLFSGPVCVAALLTRFSFRVHEGISAMSRSNVWLFVSLCFFALAANNIWFHAAVMLNKALMVVNSGTTWKTKHPRIQYHSEMAPLWLKALLQHEKMRRSQ